MSNKLRLGIWAVFLIISIAFAISGRGWERTRWMLLFFFVLFVGYETINYFVIKKRTK